MDYLKQYEKYLRVRNYSEQTLIHYLNDLSIFQRYTGKTWEQVTKTDVTAFIGEQVRRGFRPKTINRRLYVIKGFYNYLSEELEFQTKNPVRSSQIIRSGKRLQRTLEDEEIERLFEVITDIRDRAIFSLMLRCGLRVKEVSSLKLQDINLFRRELRFVGKGNKERVIPIPHEVTELLVKCIRIRPQSASNFFWNKKRRGEGVKINSIQRFLKRYAQKANIGEVHCHLLRHTFARQMTENGVDRTVLRDLMGHASISSTDVYGKLSDPFIRDSYFRAMEKIRW